MEIGMIGLGQMGLGMVGRIVRAGHAVIAYDLDPTAVAAAEALGARGVGSLDDVVSKLSPARALWLMLPAGDPTERSVEALDRRLDAGDIIVDGGNSHFRDSRRRASHLGRRGIRCLDVGTSAGLHGARLGFSLMVGGPADAVSHLHPIFDALAATPGASWGHLGPSGAGHFVKMIHNGVEYGLMQAYAAGLDTLDRVPDYDLDLAQVVNVWRHGAVARSWLLDLTASALAANPRLGSLAPYVADSAGERWTVDEAIAQVAQRGFDPWYRGPEPPKP